MNDAEYASSYIPKSHCLTLEGIFPTWSVHREHPQERMWAPRSTGHRPTPPCTTCPPPGVITSSHVPCHMSHSSPGTQGPGRTARTQGWSWEANGDCTPLYEKISSEKIIFISSRTCAALLRVPAVVAILETLPHVPPGLDLRFQTGEAKATMEKNEKIKQSRQYFTAIHLLQFFIQRWGLLWDYTQCPDPDKGTYWNMSSLEHPTT